MEKNSSKRPALFCLFIFFSTFLFSQKDTEFWFVAPEISYNVPGNYYDHPTQFVIGVYEKPAIVTLSQPANPSFSPKILNLQANSSGTFVINTNEIDFFENDPPNQVLNKGVLIQSTAPISVYYELVPTCGCNPEFFVLKGKNALGTKFFAPFQNLMQNGSNYTPFPKSAFDIVATENNTAITITPTKNIVGHAAGIPFNINLNKGQTYSATATSQMAAEHPSGSKIVSNKPIAITVKDDLLEGDPLFGGTCRDAVGDQLIPVAGCGTKYILRKGTLNGTEKAFIIGTENNTTLSYDGLWWSIINEGETVVWDINSVHFLEATAPVVVWQISGFGCEVGGAVIPTIDCSGSNSIRFVRSTDEPYFLMLITETVNQNSFLLNGSAAPFLGNGSFSVVPGTNGEWVAGLFDMSNSGILTFESTEISNSTGLFHMGVINGRESATGCRFGFFSDFGKYIRRELSTEFCQGDTIQVKNLSISTEGIFYDTISGILKCDSIFKIEAKFRNLFQTNNQIETCPGIPFIYKNIPHFPPATILDTLISTTNCDTILTLEIIASPLIFKNESHEICPNSLFNYLGNNYTAPATIIDTIFSTTACDTLLTIELTTIEFPMIDREISLCPGETVVISNKIYDQPGIVMDTISAKIGCDTIRTNTIIQKPSPEDFPIRDTVVCAGDKIILTSIYPNTTWNNSTGSQTFEATEPGIILINMVNEFGCSRTDSVNIRACCGEDGIFVPNVFSPNDDGVNDFFKPLLAERCTSFEFSVFDRWGELIFTGTDAGNGWNGKFREKLAPSGVYIWVLNYKTGVGGDKKTAKGDVALVR